MRSLTTLFLFIPFFIQAQYFEVGAFAGMSKYQGDLTSKLFQVEDLNISYGALVRFNLNEYFSIKLQANALELSGDDKYAIGTGRQARNLNFRAKVYEAALVGEFNILGFDITQDILFSPYVYLGLAGFYHNPKAYSGSDIVALQPLGTEGQGMPDYPDLEPYKLFQIAIPVGLGVKWSINDVVNIGLEGGVRKTFTDHLDDVSGTYPDIQGLLEIDPTAASLSYRQEDVINNTSFSNPVGSKRGNPDKKDWYLVGGLSVTFNLGTYY